MCHSPSFNCLFEIHCWPIMAIVQSSVLYNGILQSHVLYIHVLLSNHRTTDISTYHHSTQYCTSLPHVPNLSPSISLLS